MKTICGTDCCAQCSQYKQGCEGCAETDGHPFGGNCVAADCIKNGGFAEFQKLKEELIAEINQLHIPHLTIDDLNLLNGAFINLAYCDSDGASYRLLKDNCVYFANQIELPDSEQCIGIACDREVIVLSKYGCNGSNPQLIFYRRRLP